MKKTFLVAMLLGSSIMYSQRGFTIGEATFGQFDDFAISSLSSPKWKDNNSFTVISNNRDTIFLKSKDNKWENQFLMSALELENILNSQLKFTNFKLKRLPSDLQWVNENEILFSVIQEDNKFKHVIQLNLKTNKIINRFTFNSKGENEIISRDGNFIAWLKDNNIIITTNKGEDIIVTNDPNKDIVNGSPFTHRNEFGVDQGMWWSPKQDQLLFYKNDQSFVFDYPLVDWQQRIAKSEPLKYPMAGMPNERVSLVIYDVYTKEKIILNTGYEDQFLTMVTWDPSGNYVYVGILNRQQNNLKLNQYNAATGELEKTLFEQKATTYVEPSQGLIFLPKDSKKFIHFSEHQGYRQMYLYNTDGKLEKNLGHQDIIVDQFLGFDNTGNTAYYIGITNKGLDKNLFSVDINKGVTTALTPSSGTHKILLNQDKSYFIDEFNNIETPNRISIVNTASNKEVELENVQNPFLGKIDMPKMDLLEIKAGDSTTTLNARIIYPSNFNPSKKYPVLVYVYGGPHAQLVTNSWLGGSNLFLQYMAQNGYIVFTVDNRGSKNRGRDFEHVIHKELGKAEMADQLKGIEYLKNLPFVDQDKIGVYGWSFGGFMATSLVLNYPEVFQVAVAGGPVMDWKYYEIMYGERYMDTPMENPEGYEKNNLVSQAHKLENKLLIIHGAQDPVVLQQHSMEFIEACIKANKQVDYFLYPTHEHNVYGKDREHLNTKIANYFFDYLAKPKKE
ncbi:S9 family peptidase [Myroides sp. LJL115]